MIQEFKKFILRGNVLDMAIGIIIGASFSTIVKSLVDDIIMPPIGLLLGQVDFSNMYITLRGGPIHYNTLAEAKAAGVISINYGSFISAIISFVLVGLAVFFLVKFFERLKTKEAAQAAAKPDPQITLLTEIRDLLKK